MSIAGSESRGRSSTAVKAAEQEAKQRSAFTKWINAQFGRAGRLNAETQVQNLEADLKDGTRLIKLMSLLTPNVPVPKYNQHPKMDIHCGENLNLALGMLVKANIKVTGIGSDNILRGDKMLVLGLIWSIIYAAQIGNIKIDEGSSDSTGKSGKDGLLLWLQKQTAGYPNVHVQDFTVSFRDGLALAALINKHRPDLIDFEACRAKKDPNQIVEECFSVAERELNIPRLLEVDDMTGYPDEKINMCYLSEYYKIFSKMDSLSAAIRRVKNFVAKQKAFQGLINSYESGVHTWTQWANKTLKDFENPNSSNSLSEAKKRLDEAKEFRQGPMRERKQALQGLQHNYGIIQTTGKAHNRQPYSPPQGTPTAEELYELWEKLDDVLRKYLYAAKDSYQTQKENITKQYANDANKLAEWINQKEKELLDIKGDLPQQLDALNQLSQELQDNKLLDSTKQAAEDLESNGITTDDVPGTHHGWWDLVWRQEQLKNSVSEKKAAVEGEIAAKNQEGIAPEKLEELRSVFQRFDSSNNNELSLSEFHNCVRGLGLDLTDEKVEELFNKHCTPGKGLSLEAFFKVMCEALGDAQTREQVQSSFGAIAKGNIVITEEQLQTTGKDIVEFCLEVMSKKEGGLDYVKYLGGVFVEQIGLVDTHENTFLIKPQSVY